ncbi:MAG: hypothetical protein LBJ64_06295 [Deltaproteobacteria bacterium]|nr:hypothetical protein [Deltaproteobacteria bacterium]
MRAEDCDSLHDKFYESHNLCEHRTDGTRGVEAINLDTGAVYGGTLTAAGFSPKRLAHGYLFVLTANVGGRQRDPKERIKSRVIYVDKFGGPDEGCDEESVAEQRKMYC